MQKIVKDNQNLPIKQAENKLKRLFNTDEKQNPQFDVFRFLSVGDAYFEEGCEAAVKLVLLNQRESEDLIDMEKTPQIVEVIDKDCDSEFTIVLDKEKYDKVSQNEISQKYQIASFPKEMSSFDSLFRCINEHTKKLVDSEISYWGDYIRECDKTGAEYYIENLKAIKDVVESCSEGKECVLRLGQGIGWRFITGAWAENLETFEDFIPKIRRNNNNYKQYDFPKSRRIDDESYLLGFVKLTLKD